MPNIPLNQIVPALFNILVAPLVFVDALVANVRLEYLKIFEAKAAGIPLTVNMFLPLIKWSGVICLILIFGLFIVLESAWTIFFKNIGNKSFGAVIVDLVLLALVVFLYYFILGAVIYLFFNIILPVHLVAPE